MATKKALTLQQHKNNNRSLTWYLICRTAVITVLLGGAAIFYLKGEINHSVVTPLFYLIGIAYAEALISALILMVLSKHYVFAQLQIVWDLIFVTVLILITGGVESVFSFAYLLVIVSASFLLSSRLTVLAAACAVIMFGGILNLQFFNYLLLFNLFGSASAGTFFSAIFVHAVAFFLTAILSGMLADRWRHSEEKLLRKTVDYAELEKMNRTILSHISSGLMLINPQGRIRSFNDAAIDITKMSLADVYDFEVVKLFPQMAEIASVSMPSKRCEGVFVRSNGDKLILGYATTPAKGSQGEDLGVLVTFQDLTKLKKIEEDLKRTDRLAAVGRLAAGMAHEIRNPLASISGSVQLLMEAEHAQPEDLRLMNIVVKEADRLNGLLTDFLDFARPRPLSLELIEVSSVLDQLVAMLKTDHRFNGIEVTRNYDIDFAINLDRNQILQVLWDLAINATEAMQGKGQLLFNLEKNSLFAIIVEDSGPGIDDSIIGKVFEPFFSTKSTGTGLGLASVYSIVEAHGGNIVVSRSAAGGAKFMLSFEDGVK